MIRTPILLFFTLFLPFASYAQEADTLSSDMIVDLLMGNSITASEFGCAYYMDDRNGIILDRSGVEIPFRWGAIDDKYFSSGQCGREGCIVKRNEKSVVFSRTDRNYEQTVTVHRGNQCTGKTVLLL